MTTNCPPDFAAERARLLIGCYPNARPHDPQIYAGAVAAMLASYPREIVKAVTDPRSGLPSRHVFPPTIAEIKGACEAEIRPLIRRQAAIAAPRNTDPVVSPEAEARIGEGLKMLAERLRASTHNLVAEDAADQAAVREKLNSFMSRPD